MALITVNSVIRITETTLSNPIKETYFEGLAMEDCAVKYSLPQRPR
jgi:hypothetical protein